MCVSLFCFYQILMLMHVFSFPKKREKSCVQIFFRFQKCQNVCVFSEFALGCIGVENRYLEHVFRFEYVIS